MCAIFSPCGKDMLMYDCLPAFRLGVKRSYLLQYSAGECYSDNTAVSFTCVAWTGESLCCAFHVTRCIEKRTHFTVTKNTHTQKLLILLCSWRMLQQQCYSLFFMSGLEWWKHGSCISWDQVIEKRTHFTRNVCFTRNFTRNFGIRSTPVLPQ